MLLVYYESSLNSVSRFFKKLVGGRENGDLNLGDSSNTF